MSVTRLLATLADYACDCPERSLTLSARSLELINLGTPGVRVGHNSVKVLLP